MLNFCLLWMIHPKWSPNVSHVNVTLLYNTTTCVKKNVPNKMSTCIFYIQTYYKYGLLGNNNLYFLMYRFSFSFLTPKDIYLNFIIYAQCIFVFHLTPNSFNTPNTRIRGWLRNTHVFCYCVSDKPSSPVNQYYMYIYIYIFILYII
jgi:hypothetical protein